MNIKTIFQSLLCLLLIGFAACTHKAKQPNEIRVLYLGGNSDWQNGEFGGPKKFATEEEFQQSVTDRMNAFGELLRTYFDSVTVMRAADYKAEMSAGYDVTIFDGTPPMLEPEIREYGPDGRITQYALPRYLPADFSAAAITIGSMAETVGRRIGSKNDWYCLCLDADAHHVQTEHPIFNGPFPTKLTFRTLPTPQEAFDYQFAFDEPIPDSLAMWNVNTQGYKTEPMAAVGMVSRDEGYLDSPDAEFISSGVCAKSPVAVAIGRHGNMLTWGFASSPLFMSDEAKVVFANAVVYMAQFNGKAPIARKYNDRIGHRADLRLRKYLTSRKGYENHLAQQREFEEMKARMYAELKAKKEKGETLTANDEMMMKVYAPNPKAPRQAEESFADYLKKQVGEELFGQLGEDEAAYARHYDEIKPYVYGGFDMDYNLETDEDARAWGIANNDIRLLEKAISCLEKGEEVERARRILAHYTLCEFTQPAEWRAWFDKYKNKIFFTESGGWFFLVNEPGAPGNDYTALERRKAATSAPAATPQTTAAPDAKNPVIVNAQAKAKGDKEVELTIRLNILNGYHIYKEVGQSDPYIPLKITFQLPDGCTLKGEMAMPVARPYGGEGTGIYEGEVSFTQSIACKQLPQNVGCTVSFQCCDASVCIPPEDKVLTVPVKR